MVAHIRVFVLTLLATVLSASTVVNTTSGFVVAPWDRLTGRGEPFFDREGDQIGCNIGFYITGTGTTCDPGRQPGNMDHVGANNAGPRAQLHYLGTSGNGNKYTNVTNLNFAPSAATFAVTLMAEMAGNHARNELGVYITDGASAWTITQELILLSGSDGPGVTKYFSPGGRNFGFFVRTADSTKLYMGQSASQTWQPFAIFRGTEGGYTDNSMWSTLWIGAEDGRGGDGDFNDMIFKVTGTPYPGGPSGSLVAVAPTPEPGPLFLIASGLLAFAHLSRRFRA